ncbi:FxLD family lanthipeptide [Embleya sp. NPDC005575]|uniref:FxLD family lanthipeptide n=1 Tax=Embleya sp. NPDC005575 TaxID=3156892 RepID=UPI0033A3FC31
MTTQTIAPNVEPPKDDAGFGAAADDPFRLDITIIENTPATETVLMCSTGDNCGSSCPSACTTS